MTERGPTRGRRRQQADEASKRTNSEERRRKRGLGPGAALFAGRDLTRTPAIARVISRAALHAGKLFNHSSVCEWRHKASPHGLWFIPKTGRIRVSNRAVSCRSCPCLVQDPPALERPGTVPPRRIVHLTQLGQPQHVFAGLRPATRSNGNATRHTTKSRGRRVCACPKPSKVTAGDKYYHQRQARVHTTTDTNIHACTHARTHSLRPAFPTALAKPEKETRMRNPTCISDLPSVLHRASCTYLYPLSYKNSTAPTGSQLCSLACRGANSYSMARGRTGPDISLRMLRTPQDHRRTQSVTVQTYA
jgi:hypothetical protein